MTKIQELLYRYLNFHLRVIILSGARNPDAVSKIRIRPVAIKNQLMFQCARMEGTKEFHENLARQDAVIRLENWILKDFKQMQIQSEAGNATILVSKKGTVTIKEKRKDPEACRTGKPPQERMAELSHNRKKKYILEEGVPVPFLTDLGVMTPEGRVVKARYDKFRQINRFLEFIEDILPKLPQDRELTILDFGCGKSYLTFAMYYYLRELRRRDVKIIGLDLKEDVIARCAQLAERYGYEKLQFCQGDIASFQGVHQVDMVVTLHACDTATDYALAKAVNWGASVILSVPCCQHELNRQIRNTDMEPIFAYGVLKERIAALITDGIRAQLLEQAGYDTQILEFIDMEHTPKNLLIRAVYTGKRKTDRNKLRDCLNVFHLHPTLENLLAQGGQRK